MESIDKINSILTKTAGVIRSELQKCAATNLTDTQSAVRYSKSGFPATFDWISFIDGKDVLDGSFRKWCQLEHLSKVGWDSR
ncbi:hypothetical protein DO97_00610 [Neosynechococcus sphagnicola sy1]|uniref:Uncharacterized protein n=1 Tax=Neosynechococcus sphagnicola sy1 TaxID=1497020 RepID=A0A098TP47_9CYAN|nr:hypothetical protein DO97_00610 [Neosynechococcus sphagnicola sy1]